MRSFLSKLRLRWVQRPFNGLSPAAIFDAIYARATWGQSDDGSPFSGTGSRDERIVTPYVTQVQSFLDDLDNPSVVNLVAEIFRWAVVYAAGPTLVVTFPMLFLQAIVPGSPT